LIDIEGTYPKIEEVANISKECTVRELISIEGMNEHQRRTFGINMSGGVVNAIELGVTGFGLPTPSQWLALYDEWLLADTVDEPQPKKETA